MIARQPKWDQVRLGLTGKIAHSPKTGKAPVQERIQIQSGQVEARAKSMCQLGFVVLFQPGLHLIDLWLLGFDNLFGQLA